MTLLKSILRIYTHQQVAQHKKTTIALFRNCAFVKLSDEERNELEGLLTYVSRWGWFYGRIYKFFFELLGNNLVESFSEVYEPNELSISQRRGIITLRPKEDGYLLDLWNWQPITVLNVDCKRATKAIAWRIEASLPKLINSDQTGFIKGRHIGKNIRLIIDIMEYTCNEISSFNNKSCTYN